MDTYSWRNANHSKKHAHDIIMSVQLILQQIILFILTLVFHQSKI